MVRRDMYIDRIRAFIDNPEILKVITGMRRCGKSVMLELIKEELRGRGAANESFISLNFEMMGLSGMRSADSLHGHLKPLIDGVRGRAYVFLDEIQEVDGWERCINSLRVETDADIYLTGSNAALLSGEYATHIGGRYVQLRLLPFSFREYLDAMRDGEPSLSANDAFMRYVATGGMPFVAAFGLGKDDAAAYLRDVYASVAIKDIMQRHSIRNADLLERVLLYVFANIGHSFSANSISKYFKSERRGVAPETVLNYLKWACDAHLVYKAERYDVPSKRLLKVDEKYYVADHGFRESVFGGNERDIERVLENIVYVEMARRGYDVRVGRAHGHEIDFVCDKAGGRAYVQVAYLLAGEETREREFGAYRGIGDNFPKYVLSMDGVDFGRDGIIHMNIVDFLLAGDDGAGRPA